MVTESQMYWLTRLDALKSLATLAGFAVFFGALALIIICGLSIAAAIYLKNTDDKHQREGNEMNIVASKIRIPAYILFILGSIFAVGNLFVPTSREYAAIKVIPAVLNNTILHEQVKEDFGDFYSLAMEWAKEELRGATGDVKKVVDTEAKEVLEE